MDKNIKNSSSGILSMIAVAFLWSIAGLFIKMIDWNPFNIACLRSLIAAFFIIIFTRNIRFRLSFPLIAAGVANALTMMLFVGANKTTSAANAIILQYIAPALTAILGYFILKEKIVKENIISMIFIIPGIIIMFYDKIEGGLFLGNAMALASAFTFSLYFIFMRMQKDQSTIESILLSHLITVFLCLAASLFLPLPKFTVTSVSAIIVLGIFQLGISSVLFSKAIKKISAINANLIAVIEPIFNPVWVFIALGEKPALNTIIGGLVIVAAVTFSSIAALRKN